MSDSQAPRKTTAEYQREYFQENKQKIYQRRYPKAAPLRAKPLKKRRECLRCERMFLSKGFHNRICPKCKDISWE